MEGGFIEEMKSNTTEEASKGAGIGGQIGVSGVKVEGHGDKSRKLIQEEEVIRNRTGYSTITTLLDKLRETLNLGRIPSLDPDIYDQIEEGELYEFKADIRLHPFHLAAEAMQGWEDSGQSLGGSDGHTFVNMIDSINNAPYGKKNPRNSLIVFAEVDKSDPGYRLVMPVNKEQLLVSSLDEFSGEATFVAQVRRKIAEGQKYQVARLVRRTPIVTSAEENFMRTVAPIFQELPSVQEEGITISEEDIILRKPAMVMRLLCVYKG